MNEETLLRVKQADPWPEDRPTPEGVWHASQALDEIVQRTTQRPGKARGPLGSGPVVAVVAAVVVLVLIGGLALLINNSGETQPADTTLVETTPTTLAESPPTTLAERQPSTTVTEAVTSNTGVIAETLGMLDIALEQEEVSDSHGPGDTRALEYVYSYLTGITGSAGWPEPAFDTSLLGVESVLREVDPDARLLNAVSHRPSAGSGGVVVNPFVAAAGLEGTTIDAAFGIVLAFKDDIVDVQWRLASELQRPSALAISQWDFIDLPPTIIMVHGPRSGVDAPAFIGGLPLEASVVTTTFSDGMKVWQRPISGIAIFDDPKQCVGVPEFDSCAFEYTVLDADGDEIFRIVSDPDHEPFGYRLDTP